VVLSNVNVEGRALLFFVVVAIHAVSEIINISRKVCFALVTDSFVESWKASLCESVYLGFTDRKIFLQLSPWLLFSM
jgi:hypothetical protein